MFDEGNGDSGFAVGGLVLRRPGATKKFTTRSPFRPHGEAASDTSAPQPSPRTQAHSASFESLAPALDVKDKASPQPTGDGGEIPDDPFATPCNSAITATENAAGGGASPGGAELQYDPFATPEIAAEDPFATSPQGASLLPPAMADDEGGVDQRLETEETTALPTTAAYAGGPASAASMSASQAPYVAADTNGVAVFGMNRPRHGRRAA